MSITAVIMAGGKGTRMASAYGELPKPMIPILGKPLLEYQIDCLHRQGCRDITLVVGHLAHVIRNHFGDGTRFGVHIRYVTESFPLGSGGALYLLQNRLTEDFLLLNGDLMFDCDIHHFYRYHKAKGGIATLFTHPNSHPYDSGIVVADESGRVTQWLHKEDPRLWYRNRVNAGLHFLSPCIFRRGLFPAQQPLDLDRDVLQSLIPAGELFAYHSPEYVKDMGTPQRLADVTEDVRTGKVAAKNKSRKQKCVFLDRDGTLNKLIGHLHSPAELELLPGAAQAVKRINDAGYLAIVATNQPVIARGEVTPPQLQEIHNKLETLLGREGAYLDAIYYCPHHPHSGYPGEVSSLKRPCDCRKPAPGMLLQAAADFNIDLSASYMVGDRDTDVQCAAAAGCTPVLLTEGDADCLHFKSLQEFANARF